MKRELGSYLLLGLLSMLYAEIFSGASQLWYLTGWGILYTLPLYMLHLVFFFYLAFKYKKTSIKALYFFGILFALYEALITKVLWAGYMNETGPGMGTILGLASIEFGILVFFWHPIFSFILPILTYEILSKDILNDHQAILKKSKKKSIMLMIGLLTISTFIASGNQYNYLSANLALLGTVLLIYIVYIVLKRKPKPLFFISNMKFLFVSLWLLAIYVFGFFLLVPERKPIEIYPYLSVLFFYLITPLMIIKSKPVFIEELQIKTLYNIKDLSIGLAILIVLLNLSITFSSISSVVLLISYLFYTALGVFIFVVSVIKTIKKKKSVYIVNYDI